MRVSLGRRKDIDTPREFASYGTDNILIDTIGHTAHNSLDLLIEGCGPSQFHSIGIHASTGLSTFDVIIADVDVLRKALGGC
jgi:predicted O-linked N-acetylglucosamine transferase (SPINDLY family)